MASSIWKSPDEVEKFIKNLGTEYRYGCYEENDPQTCHLLGDYLSSISKEYSKAAKLYKKNCDDNNYALSCNSYGRMLIRGQGAEGPDYKLGLDYFIKGCDMGCYRCCYHGGQMLGVTDNHVNKLIQPDPDKAIEMLKKSCETGKQPQSCTLVHSFYLRGVHGKPADLPKAAEYAKIACDQGEFIGCKNLSRMYHLGEGVPVDIDKSAEYAALAKQRIAKTRPADSGNR